MNTVLYVLIGIVAGGIMGIMGVGAGIIIVPSLVYLAGFSQAKAVGTSLAILLPPLGLAAAIEYYKNGFVDVKAAIIIAAVMIFASWISSRFAVKINEYFLKITFGSILVVIGGYMIINTIRK